MRGRRFRPRVFPLAAPGDGRFLDAGALAARLAGRRRLVLLDSAGGAPARWHLAAFDPLCTEPEGAFVADAALGRVSRALASLERGEGERPPGPFAGGWIGALAYDLGPAGEGDLGLPRDPWGLAPAVGGLYVDFVVVERESGAAWLVLGEEPGDERPALAQRRAELSALLEAPAAEPEPPRSAGPLVRHVASATHRERVERLRERIAAGDLYQANLAHRMTRRMRGEPLALYRRLRARHPAPYAAFLDARDDARAPFALLCASPELLLELAPDARGRRTARTRPIKGTAPRAADPREDRARAEALLASAKDRAELAMIVDLERNDLGRIARPGSVRVGELPALESYASVHHLVADVLAEPRAEVGPLEVLAALFPGGSISGAPKLASLRAIAALEGEGRGYFTGSLGFVDLEGRALFNILIRTWVWRPLAGEGDGPPLGEASLSVGGGITFSSRPELEERETFDKARALLAALEEDALEAGGARAGAAPPAAGTSAGEGR